MTSPVIAVTPVDRSPDTEAAYRSRVLLLFKRARRELDGNAPPDIFATWLTKHSASLRPRTWDLYRAASLFVFREQLVRERDSRARLALDTAVATILGFARPQTNPAAPPATSSHKAKRFNAKDYKRLLTALRAGSSTFDAPLLWYLKADIQSGLRPCEWADARAERADDEFVLVVANAKCSESRAHGPYRRLTWSLAEFETVTAIEEWMAVVEQVLGRVSAADRDATWETYMDDLQRRLHDVCRTLWPRRKRQYTVYSTRHTFAAAAKALYDAPAVAALMGHATDESAGRHYARPPKGKSEVPVVNLPRADAGDMARVRRVRSQAPQAKRPFEPCP